MKQRIKLIDPSLKYDGWTKSTGSNLLYRVITPDGQRAVLKTTLSYPRDHMCNDAGYLPASADSHMHGFLPLLLKTYNLRGEIMLKKPSAILREWIDGDILSYAPTDSKIYNQIAVILKELGHLPNDLNPEQFIVNKKGIVYLIDLEEVPAPHEKENFERDLHRIQRLRHHILMERKEKEGKNKIRVHLESFVQTLLDPIKDSILEPKLSEHKHRNYLELLEQSY